jgi:hypothetical protein
MGLFSGLGEVLGIGGGEGQARRTTQTSRWMPGNISFGGFGVDATRTRGNKGPVNYSGTFDPTQTGLREGYLGLLNQGMAGLAGPQANVGGFGGISPEMLQEFYSANAQGGQLPPQFYDQAGFDQMMQSARGGAQSAWDEYNGLMANGGAGNYDHWLELMRQKAQPYENNMIQGNADKQFLKGILASTAGAYQTQGMMAGLGTADNDRQLQAYGMSQDALNNAFGRANAGTQLFQGMEGDATNRGFLLSQLQNTRASDRFQRAMSLFNTGQNANQQMQQRYMAQMGVGGGGMSQQDQQLMQMMGLQGNLAAQRSAANLGAGSALSNYTQNQAGMWTQLLSSAMESGAAAAGAMGNSGGGGGGGAAAGAAAMSDRRLKTNVRRVGTTKAGYPWYSFDYIWGESSEGVMADEVPSEWVSYTDNGYAMVDYSKVK